MPVHKRGGRWHIAFQINGRRVRRSTGAGTTKEQAKKLEAQLRASLKDRQNNVYLIDAINYWLDGDARSLKSFHKIEEHAKHIKPYCAGILLENAPDAVTNYRNAFRSKLAPATINRRCALIRRVCNLAYKEWQWIHSPVGQRIKMMPENNKPGIFLSIAQVDEITSKCKNPAVVEAAYLAAYSGLRLGEIMKLDHGNYRNGTLYLTSDTKSGKPRAIPLPRQIHDVAENLPIKATRYQVQSAFHAASVAAKIPARFHDLRHTFASLLLNAGASLSAVKELMGHSTIAITKDLYGHLEQSHLEDAIHLLERKIG